MKYIKTVAILFVLIGALAALSAALITYAASQINTQQGWMVSAASGALAIYFLALGIGLLKKKSWAWWLGFATMAIEVPIGILNAITAFSAFELFRLGMAVLMVAFLFVGRKAVLKDLPNKSIVTTPEVTEAPALGGKLKRK